MPDESNNEPPLLDIPEQPVPRAPEVLAEEVNPPNLSRPLDEFVWAEKLTEVQRKVDELEAGRTMLGQRKLYARLLFGLSVAWLALIAVLLVCVGMKWLEFSDQVIMVLIGTTTANVLGLFYIVARWLFPEKIARSKEDKK